MPNAWVEHVRKFAREKGLSYGCALSDPNLKKGYVPIGKKTKKKYDEEKKYEMFIRETEEKKQEEEKKKEKNRKKGKKELKKEEVARRRAPFLKEQDEIYQKNQRNMFRGNNYRDDARRVFEDTIRRATPYNKEQTIWIVNRERKDAPYFKRYRELDDEIAKIY